MYEWLNANVYEIILVGKLQKIFSPLEFTYLILKDASFSSIFRVHFADALESKKFNASDPLCIR